MNDFSRCNKVSGVYYIKKTLDEIKIKINLKPQEALLTLPKFEEYGNESHNLILAAENKVENYYFQWQEKVFSIWEYQRYSDIHSCASDLEIKYHEKIKNNDLEPKKLFTYIHEDYRLPIYLYKENTLKYPDECIPSLNSCLQNLSLNQKRTLFSADTSSVGHLFRSQEDLGMQEEQWVAMHIVFDNSEYNEESQLLLKQESILLSLYKNSDNCLIISPDINNLDLNPYDVESESGVKWNWQYSVEVDFERENGDDLKLLLKKLTKKWEKTNKQLINFSMSPLGKKQYFVSIEILKASGFEMDNLYTEFDIKIPENVTCNSALHGRTHVTKSFRNHGMDQWNFGHMIELILETAVEPDPLVIQIYLEVISVDWWERHRTEGYVYLSLTLRPGQSSANLTCVRPEELNRIEAENRRFFVGGCHLIKDLEVLAKPHIKDLKFRYVGSGAIKLRWSVVSQSPLPGAASIPAYPGTSSASAVLRGAEAVLKQYQRAKARLAAATKDLNEVRYEGSGDRTLFFPFGLLAPRATICLPELEDLDYTGEIYRVGVY